MKRRDLTKQVGIAALSAIAFTSSGAAQTTETDENASDRANGQGNGKAKGLEKVYHEYDVSESEIEYARGELPHFLEGTEIYNNKTVAAPDRSYAPDSDEYEIFLTVDEQQRIVNQEREKYEREHGVDPRSPSVKRFGDEYLPVEFMEDLHEEVVNDRDAVRGDIDTEEVTGYSPDELRRQLREAEEGNHDCCPSDADDADGLASTSRFGYTRPPDISETTPTVQDGEIVLYIYMPPSSSSQYPDDDVLSDSDEAFARFDDGSISGYAADDTRTVYLHGFHDPPSTDDSATQIDEFSTTAYEDAEDGLGATDQNTLATLWLDEMDHRGRARFPGFYSVNATSSSGNLPSSAWSNTTLLQHEIGHNFGCYKDEEIHDEDQAHHNWYSSASCVMHYVTQLGTDSFCSDCENTISEGQAGAN